MSQSQFAKHIVGQGRSMSRANPELERLSTLTGFGIETLFKVAWGQRPASTKLVKALEPHIKGLNESWFKVDRRGERRAAAKGRNRRAG